MKNAAQTFARKFIAIIIGIGLLASCVLNQSTPDVKSMVLICSITPNDPRCPKTQAQICAADPTASLCFDPTDEAAVLALAARVKIESANSGNAEYTTGSVEATSTTNFYLAAYDSGGDYLGQVKGSWVMANGLGTLTAGSVNPAIFIAGTVMGNEVITATASNGMSDSTGTIAVVAGPLASLVISATNASGGAAYETAFITADDIVTLYALGYDANANFKGAVAVDWNFFNDKGSFAAGPGADVDTVTGASSVTFYANRLTSAGDHAVIRAISGAINDKTGVIGNGIRITAGALASIKIRNAAANAGSDFNTAALTTDSAVPLYSAGYDSDGNYISDVSSNWSFTNDKGSFASGVDGGLNDTVTGSTNVTFYANLLTSAGNHAVIHAVSGAFSDDTGTVAAGLQISGGIPASVLIRDGIGGTGSEYTTATLTADDSVTLYSASYDSNGDFAGDRNANWSFTNDKGSFASGVETNVIIGAKNVTFYPNVVTSAANHAVIHITLGALTDDTGTVNAGIQINPGAKAVIKIINAQSSAGTAINTDFFMPGSAVTMHSASYDADGNYRGAEVTTWSRSNANGDFDTNPASTVTYTFHQVVGTDVISATDSIITGSTGTLTIGTAPTDVAEGMTGVTDFCAGNNHSCAVQSNGKVKCWGSNGNGAAITGQLGHDDQASRAELVAVLVKDSAGGDLSSVTKIACGSYFTCALIAGGTVKCWGVNNVYQLGDGTTTPRWQAVNVLTAPATNLTNVNEITVSDSHACALVSEGGSKVRCWGRGVFGQQGDGVAANNDYATLVETSAGVSLTTVNSVSAGINFTCATLADQTARCWGSNGNGQLGNNNQGQDALYASETVLDAASSTPLTNIIKVYANKYNFGNACARLASGAVKCWGGNWFNQVGNKTGIYNVAAEPMAVAVVLADGITPLLNVTGNIDFSQTATCAQVGSKGEVVCWGAKWGSVKGCGSGANCVNSATATVFVADADGASHQQGIGKIGLGFSFGCGLYPVSGHLECWGTGDKYHLGYYSSQGTHERAIKDVKSVHSPTYSDLSNVSTVSVGDRFACAVMTDTSVQCWGSGLYGEIGSHYFELYTRALPVKLSDGVTNLTGVSQVSAGNRGACALKSADGSIWCWGDSSTIPSNSAGSTFAQQGYLTATFDTLITGATSVDMGFQGGCITTGVADGRKARCWGGLNEEIIGRGQGLPFLRYAATVETAAGVDLTNTGSSISVGMDNTCVVMLNGTARCYGSGGTDANGNNSNANLYYASTSVLDNLLNPAVTLKKVDNYGSSTCGLFTDKTISCWGSRTSYALGDGANGATEPVARFTVLDGLGATLGNVIDIAVGHAGGCAIVDVSGDKKVKCWGSGILGQMGDNAFTDNQEASSFVVQSDGATQVIDAAQISGYADTYCVATTAGKVRCWGSDLSGILSSASTTLKDHAFSTFVKTE